MAAIELKSEVSGLVWKIETTVGQKVEAGDTIMIIESMKMEIPVIAEDAGTVASIAVQEGDAVTEGQTVALLQS
jgi:acetyl-CoA carboxylase biotin carboxyl carrier protein